MSVPRRPAAAVGGDATSGGGSVALALDCRCSGNQKPTSSAHRIASPLRAASGQLGDKPGGSGRPGGWADHPLALPDCDPTPGLFPRQEKRGWAEHLQGPFWLDVGWCRRLRAQHGPSCTLCPLPISRAVRAGSFGARAELVSDPRSMGNTMVGQGPASVSLQDWAATWLARC